MALVKVQWSRIIHNTQLKTLHYLRLVMRQEQNGYIIIFQVIKVKVLYIIAYKVLASHSFHSLC